jgi:hypothetical protein
MDCGFQHDLTNMAAPIRDVPGPSRGVSSPTPVRAHTATTLGRCVIAMVKHGLAWVKAQKMQRL